MTDNTSRGLYGKFNVVRTDGKSEPGQKHHGCQYFVLDCDHDPHARAALAAYAESCRAEYPILASDLDRLLRCCAFGSTSPSLQVAKSDVWPTQCSKCGPSCQCDPAWNE